MQALATKNKTENKKLTGGRKDVAFFATYRPVGKTCPSECPYLKENVGCYAMEGRTALVARKSQGLSCDFLEYINSLPQKAVIRHNVSGDLFMDDAPDTEYISSMLEGHKTRPDVVGLGYTHGWRRLENHVVNGQNNLTFNASTDSKEEAREALKKGWPTVMTVGKNAYGRGLFDFGDFYGVVCPAQTTKTSCAACMLCAKKNRTMRGKPLVVLFRWHETPLSPKGWRDPINRE